MNSPTPPQRGANQPGGLFARARENPVTRPAQPCTVSRYKRLFCLGVPRIRTVRPRRSGAQISPVGCLRGRGRIPSPDRCSPVPCPGTNGFFVMECRGFEQPDPAAAGRKSARWAVCEGAGESRHPTGAALYRVPVQTAFLSWSAEGSNSPAPPQRGANQPAVLCENCCHNVKIAKWGGILPPNGV